MSYFEDVAKVKVRENNSEVETIRLHVHGSAR